MQVRGAFCQRSCQGMPGRFWREEIIRKASADHVLFRDDGHGRVGPCTKVHEIRIVVDQVHADPLATESTKGLDSMMPIENHEIAVCDEDGSLQNPVAPDLFRQLPQQRGANLFVTMQPTNLD